MSSEVACQAVALREGWRHLAKFPLRWATGWKAWPRRILRLRCSLDSAPDDV